MFKLVWKRPRNTFQVDKQQGLLLQDLFLGPFHRMNLLTSCQRLLLVTESTHTKFYLFIHPSLLTFTLVRVPNFLILSQGTGCEREYILKDTSGLHGAPCTHIHRLNHAKGKRISIDKSFHWHVLRSDAKPTQAQGP